MNKTAQQYKPDYIVAVTVIALALFGIIMVFSATYYSEQASGNTGEEFYFSQVLGVVIGISIMFILSYIDYHIFSNIAVVFGMIIISIVFLIIVFLQERLMALTDGLI